MAMITTTGERDAQAARVTEQLVSQLQSPSAYREKTTGVELIETHISWVFLTDHFAYKLKKPVRFDFLDFSSAELRRQACEKEVQLNRRLAPGVYLGVVPVVTAAKGRFAVGGEGIPVDWLVKMKRLPATASLDVMIREKTISAPGIEQLAQVLSAFYEKLPPEMITVESYRRSIERHVIANREELAAEAHHLDLAKIRRAHAAQLRVLKLAPGLFDERVRNGRIVEGHGDLRPEHIYFHPSPVIIDCIEFSREFRTLDVADELAFLSVECDFLGAEEIARPIIARYTEQSGDRVPRQVLDFYRLYRACVRAKVCALRAQQLTGAARERWLASAGKYLDLADQYAATLSPPILVLVRGLPGTGKSTIAQTISEELGMELLQTDALRQELFGPAADRIGFGEGRYRPENRTLVYDEMHRQADMLLKEGLSTVLDGTYLAASARAGAAELAERHQAELLSVHCQCPAEIALERITTRARAGRTTSDARPEFFDRQRDSEEPDTSGREPLVVDTSSGVAGPMRVIFDELRNIQLARGDS